MIFIVSITQVFRGNHEVYSYDNVHLSQSYLPYRCHDLCRDNTASKLKYFWRCKKCTGNKCTASVLSAPSVTSIVGRVLALARVNSGSAAERGVVLRIRPLSTKKPQARLGEDFRKVFHKSSSSTSAICSTPVSSAAHSLCPSYGICRSFPLLGQCDVQSSTSRC
jgi:hypothetical protein